MIKDSGNRREFDSGAVRDIAEGKGRCDLLPPAPKKCKKYKDVCSCGVPYFPIKTTAPTADVN